jgi:hypothetical protein
VPKTRFILTKLRHSNTKKQSGPVLQSHGQENNLPAAKSLQRKGTFTAGLRQKQKQLGEKKSSGLRHKGTFLAGPRQKQQPASQPPKKDRQQTKRPGALTPLAKTPKAEVHASLDRSGVHGRSFVSGKRS